MDKIGTRANRVQNQWLKFRVESQMPVPTFRVIWFGSGFQKESTGSKSQVLFKLKFDKVMKSSS